MSSMHEAAAAAYDSFYSLPPEPASSGTIASAPASSSGLVTSVPTSAVSFSWISLSFSTASITNQADTSLIHPAARRDVRWSAWLLDLRSNLGFLITLTLRTNTACRGKMARAAFSISRPICSGMLQQAPRRRRRSKPGPGACEQLLQDEEPHRDWVMVMMGDVVNRQPAAINAEASAAVPMKDQ